MRLRAGRRKRGRRAILAAAAALLVIAAPASAATFNRFGLERFDVPDFPAAVASEDLDGNERPDYVTANGSNNVSVFLQDENGGLTREDLPTEDFPRDVEIGDLNDDGRLDIAAVNPERQEIYLFLQDANGDWDRETISDVERPETLAVGDLDDDGDDDIAVSPIDDSKLLLFLQDSSGDFQRSEVQVGDYPAAVVIEDIDEDGDNDLITTNYHGDSVSFLLQSSNGTFQRRDRHAGERPQGIAVSDLEQDGDLDVVVTNDWRVGRDRISILKQRTPIAGERPAFDRVELRGPDSPRRVAIGDIDSDGDADIAADMSFQLQKPDGGFDRVDMGGPGPTDLLMHDSDRDGDQDLVVAATDIYKDPVVTALFILRNTGRPVPRCDGQEPNAVGTEGSDSFGDPDPATKMVAVGLGGKDVIATDGGPLCGGRGPDTLLSSCCGARLFGDSGDDWLGNNADLEIENLYRRLELFGGSGDDRLNGSAVSDLLDGGDGDDTILGEIGWGIDPEKAGDRIRGGDGRDLLLGRDGDDLLFGGIGGDYLKGDGGDDTADGGAHIDECRAEVKRDCER